ncbi:MAG: YHS domain-containing (seleno)protein [Desulfobacterales bacterium]|nr:YHS domain-containing (seleno)protein [Desulfobacterales bacterium]MDJ0875547.1 YHS domain-containing (seleno)protein [Desulfobacterales bacterium]MDJ0883407.1 YHS domain-containing (seleno)protein [Desulfobacterales bacterium]
MILLNLCKNFIIMALLPLFIMAVNVAAVSAAEATTATVHGIAIKGYDPVAYFTEGQAIKGSSVYAYNWNEASWHFSKPEHRDLFAADPDRYAPQFGGHCANGLSKGKLVAADPEEWTIVDGKLYMNYNRPARDDWRTHKAVMIERAESNWAGIH